LRQAYRHLQLSALLALQRVEEPEVSIAFFEVAR